MHQLTASGRGAQTILQVVPQLVADQVNRTVVEICQRLKREGWTALVATAGGPLERDVVATGAEIVRLPLHQTGPLASWRHVLSLTRLCRRRGVAIVHAHRRSAAWLAGHAAKRSGAVFLGTVHDLSDVALRRPQRKDDLVLLAGDRVIAVSDYVADELVQHSAVERERVRVVPPGIDMAELDPERVRGARVAALAERWDIGVDRRIVLVPGPMTREQGHLLVMRAIAKLPRDDYLALFLGTDETSSSYARQIQSLVQAGTLASRIRFAGPCHDIPAALQLADVLVMPASAPLASARVVTAAQAMGRPAIVSDKGALPETIMPAATGWVVPADDPDELAWALDRALSMEDEVKERMATRARSFAAGTFGLDVVGQKLMDVYRELLPVI